MSAFEFYFSFFGLLLGFSVAEVTSGLASALNARRRVRIGWLTPLLALFILLDIMSFWMFAWANRDHVTVGWSTMFGGLVIAVTYYLAASLLFPRERDEWASLDEHYWAQKRMVVAGVGVANLVLISFTVFNFPLGLNDWPFMAWQLAYFLPLAGLLFSKRERTDLALLAFLVAYYLVIAANIIPDSDWGSAAGV